VVFRLENASAGILVAGRLRVRPEVLFARPASCPAEEVEEETVPSWLWRSVPDARALAELPIERYVSELSAKQVFDRLAGLLDLLGLEGRLFFTSEDDARAFLRRAPLHAGEADVAPNSPQWFNTGLHWPTASMAPARATITSTGRPANLQNQIATSIRSRTPASSRASRTTCQRGRHHGPVGARRRACSNTAPHRIELSRLRGEGENFPAAAAPPA